MAVVPTVQERTYDAEVIAQRAELYQQLDGIDLKTIAIAGLIVLVGLIIIRR